MTSVDPKEGRIIVGSSPPLPPRSEESNTSTTRGTATTNSTTCLEQLQQLQSKYRLEKEYHDSLNDELNQLKHQLEDITSKYRCSKQRMIQAKEDVEAKEVEYCLLELSDNDESNDDEVDDDNDEDNDKEKESREGEKKCNIKKEEEDTKNGTPPLAKPPPPPARRQLPPTLTLPPQKIQKTSHQHSRSVTRSSSTDVQKTTTTTSSLSSPSCSLQRSIGRPRDWLNANLNWSKCNFTAKFTISTFGTKDSIVQWIVLNDEWNELVTDCTKEQIFYVGIGCNLVKFGRSFALNTTKSVPYFQAPKVKEHTKNIYYVGHWIPIKESFQEFDSPIIIKGSQRQMVMKLRFEYYDSNLASLFL